MSFHAYAKPSDYILPTLTPRANLVYDSDLVSSAIPVRLQYQGSTSFSSFTAPDGGLNGVYLDYGLDSAGNPDRWAPTQPGWAVQSNKGYATSNVTR